MQAARRLWLGIILSLAVPGAATPFAQEPPEAPAEEAAGAAQPPRFPKTHAPVLSSSLYIGSSPSPSSPQPIQMKPSASMATARGTPSSGTMKSTSPVACATLTALAEPRHMIHTS